MDKEAVKKEVLERVKETFTIKDNLQDTYIKNLTSNAYDEFCIITGEVMVNAKYLMVIEGVVNKRYVRRGSDGLTSENSDGYSVSYKDTQSDFSDYYGILSKEFVITLGAERRGSVRFY